MLVTSDARGLERWVAACPVPSLVVDGQGVILACNQHAAGLLAWPAAEGLLGLRVRDVVPAADAEALDEHLRRVCAGRATEPFAQKVARGRMPVVHWLWRAQPVDDGGGAIVVIEDVTAKVEAERELARARCLDILVAQTTEQLLEASPDEAGPVVERILAQVATQVGADGAAFTILAGAGPDVEHRQVWSDPGTSTSETLAMGPDLQRDYYRWLLPRIAGRNVLVVEPFAEAAAEPAFGVDLLEAAGIRWIAWLPFSKSAEDIGIVTLFARQGSAPRAVDLMPLSLIAGVLFTGWTRLRAQKTLRQTQARADAVLDTIPDAVITCAQDGTILSANPATANLFGHAVHDLVGRNVDVLMTDGDRQAHGDHLDRYRRTRAPRIIGVGRDVVGRRADGSTFPARLSIGESYVDGRRLYVGVLGDLTARHRLEAELRQAQKLEVIGRLAGGIAHDFNNLLTVINGYAELVASDVAHGTSAFAHLTALRDAGERAAALTGQLLAWSRRRVVQLAAIDLNDVVTDMRGMLSRLIGDTIEITTSLERRLPSICADRSQIEQVIMNLVLNARDAMPNGGHVSITTRTVSRGGAAGPQVRLSVTDDGHGMSPEIRDHIFEPFFTTKDPGRGTGLGLATVARIVATCNGTIDVESAPGRGATFHLEFPATAVPAKAAGHKTPIAADLPRGSELVVVVDDEAALRVLCARILEGLGYEVRTAGTAAEALALLAPTSPPPALIVTDLVLPDLNGRELAQRVRERAPQGKILFVSGYGEDEMFRRGIVGDELHFLQKPFTPASLARKVRETLDRVPSADAGGPWADWTAGHDQRAG